MVIASAAGRHLDMETSCATIFFKIRTAILEDCAMSSHLTELGQEAVAAVSRSVTGGTPLVKCQLLASMPIELQVDSV